MSGCPHLLDSRLRRPLRNCGGMPEEIRLSSFPRKRESISFYIGPPGFLLPQEWSGCARLSRGYSNVSLRREGHYCIRGHDGRGCQRRNNLIRDKRDDARRSQKVISRLSSRRGLKRNSPWPIMSMPMISCQWSDISISAAGTLKKGLRPDIVMLIKCCGRRRGL